MNSVFKEINCVPYGEMYKIYLIFNNEEDFLLFRESRKEIKKQLSEIKAIHLPLIEGKFELLLLTDNPDNAGLIVHVMLGLEKELEQIKKDVVGLSKCGLTPSQIASILRLIGGLRK